MTIPKKLVLVVILLIITAWCVSAAQRLGPALIPSSDTVLSSPVITVITSNPIRPLFEPEAEAGVNRLLIDGAGNYLIIDGASNRLRVDGSE